MKTLKIFSLFLLFLTIADSSFGQKIRTETFPVSGECGMCKKKIEKAAKEAGASSAIWDQQTKLLKVTYNAVGVNLSSVQQKIAGVGYDTPLYRATDEAYHSLSQCCQYTRVSLQMDCCGSKCEIKDGKCINEAACKEKGCCTDSGICKDMACCKKTDN
jgi:periplasmic mercuric ion binding protein